MGEFSDYKDIIVEVKGQIGIIKVGIGVFQRDNISDMYVVQSTKVIELVRW